MKAVQYGSEGYEGGEGLAELLVARADTAAVFDAGEEITLGEEVDDLRKDETSHEHGTGLYRKLGPKRLKSMTFAKY